jgi:hypothetical protein
MPVPDKSELKVTDMADAIVEPGSQLRYDD